MAGVDALRWPDTDNQFKGVPADAIVDSWFLMSSPTPILSLLLFYLYFVLSLGPKLMESRKPFDLKYTMVLYNLYQVVFSSWLCSRLIFSWAAIKYIYNHACMPLDRGANPLVSILNDSTWWYFMSKVVELLDTLFFVLRKKQNQVSVLHVWHHSNMVLSTWIYLKYIRGEQAILPGFINSCVHVVMYSYYLLAAMGPAIQRHLWWKKYITKLQLGQFLTILCYLSLLVAFDCKVPSGLTAYIAINTIIFLVLFLNFYRQAYNKKDRKDRKSNICLPEQTQPKPVKAE
ncbi:hypothetical protein GE061_007954 [Apolygus lucorum]|uniref:Elongation of very long chain fatty acids protein n=1 Tax=Apolygus lucorum TaxID=248454 RepID=A0A8S9WNE4_APOLU|nr:hypothetical protein GE061_007954 [Apolygus lucorum]